MIEAYIKFEPPLPGESVSEGHVGWIEIDKWDFDVTRDREKKQKNKDRGEGDDDYGAFDAVGSMEQGVLPKFTAIDVSKDVDSASPMMMISCAKGTKFGTVTIEQCKAGAQGAKKGGVKAFIKIVLANVYITSYKCAANDGYPKEDFKLHYETIKMTYRQQKDDGTLDKVFEKGWNCPKGTEL